MQPTPVHPADPEPPVVRGLGLRDGEVESPAVLPECTAATPGDGEGVRTRGDSGLLCHDLRRLPAAADLAATPTPSLCLSPDRELGRPPADTGDDEPMVPGVASRSAGDPGALEPGELLKQN